MKATINALGTLVVIAEDSVESYALRKWFEDQDKKHPGINSALTIQHPPSAVVEPATYDKANCNKEILAAGKAYPRTCKVCGLGPCVRPPLNSN